MNAGPVGEALAAGRAWLAGARGADGSLGYEPGQEGRPEPSLLLAAAGLPAPVAWLEARPLGWAGRLAPALLRGEAAADGLRSRELALLLAGRAEEAPGDEGIRGWGWVEGTAPWVEPTACALLSLRAAGLLPCAQAAEAERFLLARRCATGAWNYGDPRSLGRDLAPQVVPTGWALLALAGLPASVPACTEAFAWLDARVRGLPTAQGLALRVLAGVALGLGDGGAAARLAGSRRADGSWLGRADLTALACAALAAALGTSGPLPLRAGSA